jgi:hypothetical protein
VPIARARRWLVVWLVYLPALLFDVARWRAMFDVPERSSDVRRGRIVDFACFSSTPVGR